MYKTRLSSGDQGDNNEVYECGYYYWSIIVTGAASMCSRTDNYKHISSSGMNNTLVLVTTSQELIFLIKTMRVCI